MCSAVHFRLCKDFLVVGLVSIFFKFLIMRASSSNVNVYLLHTNAVLYSI